MDGVVSDMRPGAAVYVEGIWHVVILQIGVILQTGLLLLHALF